MGALASLDLIEKYQIDPLSIDVILCITEEYKEYPLTTSACYVQDRIGALNAWGIDVQNRCCTCVSAMKLAHDVLVADGQAKRVLVVGGYRNVDFVDYTDKDMSMMYNLAAGGGAILLERDYEKNLLLGSHIISDGSLARTAGVVIGGQCNPITAKNYKEARHSLRLMDPLKMKNRLNEVSMPNWYKCIDESLRKAGYTREDFAKNGYLAILHIKRSGHESLLKDLGLTPEQTIYLEDYGHIGQIDQILSLHLALKKKKIKKGTLICMLAAGIGYVWAANIIRWG
ncbi:MAG: 3-oxoacyl-ACP synthase, partial [Bacillales bacterium]|jgi:3-oxoacyl-[acyl-carrier-protein] synthase-3|nr:3-oxoacyl-ACP synthase [Bacillales bacterium]